jgi:hypothetical protein
MTNRNCIAMGHRLACIMIVCLMITLIGIHPCILAEDRHPPMTPTPSPTPSPTPTPDMPPDEFDISGTVWITQDEDPFPYPELELNGSGWTISGDVHGEYRFTGLAPGGPYIIRIVSQPYPGMRWDREEMEVTISWDDVEGVDFFMVEDSATATPTATPTVPPEVFSISGHAWKVPDTIPYAYAEFRLEENGHLVTADESGFYRFNDLSPGTYTVSILSEPIEGFQWHRNQETVDVIDEDLTGVDFYLIPSGPPPPPDPDQEKYLSVDIRMPSDYFRHGDPFWIQGRIHNESDQWFGGLNQVFVLGIAGTYYFWPDWQPFNPTETPPFSAVPVELSTGLTLIDVIDDVTWPYTGQLSLTDILVFGTLMDEHLTRLIGTPGSARFGFGP